MRLAIIGGGISGLYAARLLHEKHEISVFESGSYAGGHTNTLDVEIDGQSVTVDTGFIVHNDRNYPMFVSLMEELGVATQDSEMSFSFSCALGGLEYCGSTINTIFAQRRNLFSPRFISMLREIWRFNGLADELLNAPAEQNLADFLRHHNFSGPAVDDYLLPMAGAIWSSEAKEILDFPAAYFGHFFDNHGLLSLNDRPQWKTVCGGSRNYVEPLIAPFRERVQLNAAVRQVERNAAGVTVITADGNKARFDAVVFACHSDQALQMLARPTARERTILGAIPYQPNEAILHTDISLMPRRRRAWASWNYHRFEAEQQEVCVTYDMTHLQHLKAPERLLVSLNAATKINPDKVLRRINYEHPMYNRRSVAARRRWQEISGENRSYYCGAYWGYGFHEDGMRSAAAVAKQVELQVRAAA